MGNGRNGCRTTYIKSKSTSNQRIECFWGQLRKQCAEYWIVLLSTLEDTGNFAGDFVDKSLCQFCFMGQLQVSSFNDSCNTLYLAHCPKTIMKQIHT